MENSKQKQIEEVVYENVVRYFVNSITSHGFIEKYIRPITDVSDEQEEKICEILAEYNREWDAAPCDEDGATHEQIVNLDKIIDNCSCNISVLLNN